MDTEHCHGMEPFLALHGLAWEQFPHALENIEFGVTALKKGITLGSTEGYGRL